MEGSVVTEMGSAFRYALMLITVTVLQKFLFQHARIDDVGMDAFLALSVTAGLVAGPRRGAIVGFAAGIALDLTVVTPFGLGALSYLVAGVVAGSMEKLIKHSARSLTMLVGFVSAFVGLLFFVAVGSIIGVAGLIDGHLPVVLLIVSASTAVLVLPCRRAVHWAESPSNSLNPALHRWQ